MHPVSPARATPVIRLPTQARLKRKADQPLQVHGLGRFGFSGNVPVYNLVRPRVRLVRPLARPLALLTYHPTFLAYRNGTPLINSSSRPQAPEKRF